MKASEKQTNRTKNGKRRKKRKGLGYSIRYTRYLMFKTLYLRSLSENLLWAASSIDSASLSSLYVFAFRLLPQSFPTPPSSSTSCNTSLESSSPSWERLRPCIVLLGQGKPHVMQNKKGSRKINK